MHHICSVADDGSVDILISDKIVTGKQFLIVDVIDGRKVAQVLLTNGSVRTCHARCIDLKMCKWNLTIFVESQEPILYSVLCRALLDAVMQLKNGHSEIETEEDLVRVAVYLQRLDPTLITFDDVDTETIIGRYFNIFGLLHREGDDSVHLHQRCGFLKSSLSHFHSSYSKRWPNHLTDFSIFGFDNTEAIMTKDFFSEEVRCQLMKCNNLVSGQAILIAEEDEEEEDEEELTENELLNEIWHLDKSGGCSDDELEQLIEKCKYIACFRRLLMALRNVIPWTVIGSRIDMILLQIPEGVCGNRNEIRRCYLELDEWLKEHGKWLELKRGPGTSHSAVTIIPMIVNMLSKDGYTLKSSAPSSDTSREYWYVSMHTLILCAIAKIKMCGYRSDVLCNMSLEKYEMVVADLADGIGDSDKLDKQIRTMYKVFSRQ